MVEDGGLEVFGWGGVFFVVVFLMSCAEGLYMTHVRRHCSPRLRHDQSGSSPREEEQHKNHVKPKRKDSLIHTAQVGLVL